MKKNPALILISLILLVVLLAFLSLEDHESRSSERTEFVMDRPYLAVVRGLAKKDSLEKVVEQNDGRVEEKNWESFRVEVPQRILRIKDYRLEGELRFTVRKTDPSLGELSLPFAQKMNMDEHLLALETRLLRPQKNVVLYDKTVEISPRLDGEGTHVSIRSELAVRKRIPFFLANAMDQRVKEANGKDAERLKENIMKSAGPTLTILRR